MPSLDPAPTRAVDIVYVVSAVDKSGRVADRNVVRVMGWAPGTRLSIRERAGSIVVAPDAHGGVAHDIAHRQVFRTRRPARSPGWSPGTSASA